jgi:hypothetical protein
VFALCAGLKRCETLLTEALRGRGQRNCCASGRPSESIYRPELPFQPDGGPAKGARHTKKFCRPTGTRFPPAPPLPLKGASRPLPLGHRTIAYVLAYRGEADRAFEWLDKAAAYHSPALGSIIAHPFLANIHDDPRWLPFLRRIGMAPEQLAAIKFDVKVPN